MRKLRPGQLRKFGAKVTHFTRASWLLNCSLQTQRVCPAPPVFLLTAGNFIIRWQRRQTQGVRTEMCAGEKRVVNACVYMLPQEASADT